MKTNKFFILCLLIAVHSLSQSFFAQTPQPTATPSEEQEDVIKVSTTLIQVDVVVTDKNNKQVRDLKLEDFEIYENGIKREINSFTHVSSKPTGKSSRVSDDNLNLQDDDGMSLKDKIAVPTISKPEDPNSVRRTFVLVVDNLGLNFSSVNVVKSALKQFIKEQIKEGDLATIVTTSGSSVLPSFTSDKKALLAIVQKLKWSPQSRGGADSYEPIRSTLLEELSEGRGYDLPGTMEQAALLDDIDRTRKTNASVGTIASLNYIVNGMRNLSGRKALVLFSEGFSLSETTSQDPSNAETADADKTSSATSAVSGSLKSLIDAANQSSVVIYALDPRGLDYLGMANADDDIKKAFGRNFKPGQTGDKRTDREDYFRQTQEGLRLLAGETGGFAVLNQNDIDKGLERIIDDQSYYLLSYVTNLETVNSSQDAIDKVEIRVKQPDVDVRYRSAFYSPNSRIEDSTAPQTPREKIGQALAYPFKANEIKLNLYSITGRAGYADFVRFLINISAKDLEFKREGSDSRKANIDMLAITLDSDGKPIDQFSKNFSITVNEATYRNILKRGFVYVLPVVLKKSGVYHFRIAIRDSLTGKVGAAAQFLETPKFEKKRLWVSNLTLTQVSSDRGQQKGQESNNRVFTDTTLREFDSPVTLLYGAEVYNAKSKDNGTPDLTIQTRLIHNDKVLLETPPEPISMKDQTDPQKIELFGRIQIKKNLPPGDYVFQIIVVDQSAKKKTQIATQWIDFEIIDD